MYSKIVKEKENPKLSAVDPSLMLPLSPPSFASRNEYHTL